mmetsp:Transcript_28908/g.94122  ORF Transcript_28908/g.94122 Transcript_28908/m.94122 type:complete len:107 (+) Transcript_28908:2906-3226(+)
MAEHRLTRRLASRADCAVSPRPAKLQRAMLHSAVRLLRPGGVLVFSTCTLNPDECEANVAYALDTFPELVLVPPRLRVGPPPPPETESQNMDTIMSPVVIPWRRNT